jgi:methionyl-tRNA formyltransferase
MRILFAGNKERGVKCLEALLSNNNQIIGVIAHPSTAKSSEGLTQLAEGLNVPLFQPSNVNDKEVLANLWELKPDLTVLAGYGQIVKKQFIDLAPLGCINLHGGKLPKYRGSSPMNWALMNGEEEFTLSVIRVDEGVDTGDVLCERTYPVSIDDTIAEVQEISNKAFPEMLVEVVNQVQAGTTNPRKQDEATASYYPLRFPDDGLIFFDTLTAVEVHNRIRALTTPYPGAHTFYKGKKLKLLRSRLTRKTYFGEPGRVYLKNENGLLVCAKDRCLWITDSIIENDNSTGYEAIDRYSKLATLRDLAVQHIQRT